jgi:hypothetical protein
MQQIPTVTRVKNFVSQLGILGIGPHIYRKLLTTVPNAQCTRLYLMELAHPKLTPKACQAAKGHRFRFATEDDIKGYIQHPETLLFERDRESLRAGARCLLQLDGEKLVGYTWIHSGPMIELAWGIHFNMAEDMVYNYNGFTLPEYRGTAFQALRHLHILEHVGNEGKKRLFSYVHHTNYKSLRGVTKSGYRKVGVIRCVKSPKNIRFHLSVKNRLWSNAVRIGPYQHGE